MQRGRLWWNIFIMHAILSEKLALREAAVWPMQWCAQTQLRRVWCAVSMIILKDLYFIENNIRILNSVAHGQKQQFDITQWRDATHYTQWGCTYTKERNDVYHEVWDGARGGLFRRRKGDAQTGPPQDWPLSDHSVPQDDTALPETVLHFVLLYLTFPGISVNFLVLSLYLNSFWKDPNTTVLISNPIKGEKKMLRKMWRHLWGGLSHSTCIFGLFQWEPQSGHRASFQYLQHCSSWTLLHISFNSIYEIGLISSPNRSRCFNNNIKYSLSLAYWAPLDKGIQAQRLY